MRPALTYAAIFVAATALDWTTALAIRYTAERSPMAMLYAVLLTALWWLTVRAAVKRPSYLIPLLLAAAVGTGAGIKWL